MFSRLKEQAVRNHKAVRYFSMGAVTWLVFAIGLARYRSVLCFGLFFILWGFVAYSETKHKLLTIALLPSLLVTLYLDVHNGQLFPVVPHLSVLITIVSLVVIGELFMNGIYRVLTKWSGGALFEMCPRCKCNNKSLVDQCSHCSYKKTLSHNEIMNKEMIEGVEIDPAIASEIAEYRKAWFEQPTKKILSLLGLHRNEFVLTNLNLSPLASYFKDGVRSVAGNMVLTTERIIFIHRVFFEKGWRMREDVPYSELIEVCICVKRLVVAEEPVISIKTQSCNYEICFRTTTSYEKRISAIISCIRGMSPGVKITTDATYERFTKQGAYRINN